MIEGDPAPDFELLSHAGNTVTLGEFRGKKNLVLCFYPKNRLFGCPSKKVHEMTGSMTESYPSIAATGTEVMAISSDSAESQKEFVARHKIPYMHLADPSKKACKEYAGLNIVGLARRATFVVDREGVVRKIFRDIDARRHGKEVLEFLKSF